jgi:tRNA (guanine37-N1)-methyltransferase
MRAVKVPKRDAENEKRRLTEAGLLATDHYVDSDEDHVYLPVTENATTDYQIVDRDLDKKKERKQFDNCLKTLLTNDEQKHMKTSQDIIGDIAIIEISDELDHKKHEIGECLLTTKPYISTVLRKGKHTGTYRTQSLDWLAGDKKKETVHTENGVDLKLNVETVYFSPRLASERKRIASLTGDEDVLVMYSGCGPYPIVIAANSPARHVTGVEINPEAHRYAVDNIARNKLSNVTVYHGDVETVLPAKERYDRVVMPAPHDAHEHIEIAIDCVKPNGWIHYYDFCKEDDIPEPIHGLTIEHTEQCGQVKAGVYRTCFDIKVRP